MNDSEIFIVGANGQLGQALLAQYPGAQSADIDELDITDEQSVKNFDWTKIKVILNAAAFTNVDGAETSDGRKTAWQVNAAAVANLAREAMEHDLLLVHVSTDYVFDGTLTPHTETEVLSPLSVYGESKAAGDLIVSLLPKYYLLRTSWVIGSGNNFVRTMLKLGKDGVNPSVVSDQIGRLTFTTELVRAIDHLLTNHAAYGVYNLSNGGTSASWADITRRIFELANFDNTVTDVTTEEYYAGKSGIAPRPLNSELDLTKITASGFEPHDWNVDLEAYVKEELAV